VVILPGADQVQGRTIAERIHATAAARPYEAADGGLIPLHLSVGIASYPHDGHSANTLLTVADERMYAAKRSGTGVQGPARTTEEHAQQTVGGFGTLEALVAAVDNKDSYTAKHSDQVAQFALLLARQLGVSQETLRTLRIAGLLHDVGKIGVPDRVLRKPGRLTTEEGEVMQQHVQLSEMLVRTIMPDPGVLDAVRYHHERWDGRGYPYGVAGEGVPLLGRIMIVADAVSAMVMDRPYRKGLSLETVSSELRRAAGAQFDPALVEPFIAAFGEISRGVAGPQHRAVSGAWSPRFVVLSEDGSEADAAGFRAQGAQAAAAGVGSVRFEYAASSAGSRSGILLLKREEKNDAVPALRRPHNDGDGPPDDALATAWSAAAPADGCPTSARAHPSTICRCPLMLPCSSFAGASRTS